MVATIETVVAESNKLISFPGVAIKVNSMVSDPTVTAKDLGKVISGDDGGFTQSCQQPIFWFFQRSRYDIKSGDAFGSDASKRPDTCRFRSQRV